MLAVTSTLFELGYTESHSQTLKSKYVRIFISPPPGPEHRRAFSTLTCFLTMYNQLVSMMRPFGSGGGGINILTCLGFEEDRFYGTKIEQCVVKYQSSEVIST